MGMDSDSLYCGAKVISKAEPWRLLKDDANQDVRLSEAQGSTHSSCSPRYDGSPAIAANQTSPGAGAH
jgi:hypothetical protein